MTQTIAVRADFTGGVRNVEAPTRWAEGGLFIHPRYRTDETFAPCGAYVIAHAESGYALHGGSFKRLADARRFARQLLTLGDWGRVGAKLSADRQLAEAATAIIRCARIEGVMNR